MIWNDGKPMDFWVPYQTKPFLRHQFWNKTSLCISRPGQCGNPPGHDLKDERISTSLETTWDFSTASHSLKVGRVLMFWGGDLQHSEFFRDNWIFSILAGLFFWEILEMGFGFHYWKKTVLAGSTSWKNKIPSIGLICMTVWSISLHLKMTQGLQFFHDLWITIH